MNHRSLLEVVHLLRPLSNGGTVVTQRSTLLATALLMMAGAVEAQTPPQPGPLPQEVQNRIMEVANDPATLRITGRSRIPSGTLVDANVVVLGGNLNLGGEVTGSLFVVNGSLELDPGAVVTGPVLVVGGRLSGLEEATLTQPPEVYAGPLLYRVRADRIEGVDADGRVPSQFLDTDLGIGRSRLTLRAAGPYNRVEGLPVQFGPIFASEGRNPLILEAFGIWRSEAGLSVDTERLGYEFTVNQAMGGRGTLSAGLSTYSRIQSIEERGMSNLETSLATFLMRRDYRDYYEAQGWSAHLDARPIRFPIHARLAFREEENSLVLPGGPWTLGDGDRPWRAQPAIADGTAQFLEGSITLDTRDDPDHPADGWWAHFRTRWQLGGQLQSTFDPQMSSLGGEGPEFARIRWAELDLRRYARLSPSSQVNLRIHGAGSLTSNPIPPQFQSALGGEGSLPGHPRFALDCGARSEGPVPVVESNGEDQAYPFYGCDRVTLGQIEFQQDLPISWEPLPDDWGDPEWSGSLRIQPALSLFVSAGQGWARNQDGFPERPDSSRRGDVGLGLVTGSLGLYWAYPLNRKERGLNFFVRLHHRF